MTIRVNYPSWQDATRAIATFWNAYFSGERLNRGVITSDDIISIDNTKGMVLKSPNGHYWRVTIDNTGALITTDLGSTPP